jgi:putative membrane protein
MDANPRIQSVPDDTLIRDRLALIRTVLANERTFLAYLRTSLALLATGVTAIHFIPNQASTWSGVLLVALGFSCLIYGAVRFRFIRHDIRENGRRNAGTDS